MASEADPEKKVFTTLRSAEAEARYRQALALDPETDRDLRLARVPFDYAPAPEATLEPAPKTEPVKASEPAKEPVKQPAPTGVAQHGGRAEQVVEESDIVIIEGLNVLQSGATSGARR